jgi:TrmH family RNA methyltransferase
MRIISTSNERIRAVRRLHRGRERRQTMRTLIEGPNLVSAALAANVVPAEIYSVEGGALVARCRAAGSAVFEVSAPVLKAISTTVEPQDPVGVIAIPEQPEIEATKTVVAVEIGDPGNAGTLIRTAGALGWQMALFGGVDPWSPKVLRASAGVQILHPAVAITSLDPLLAVGLRPVATTASGGIDPSSLTEDRPIALLIGSEAHGLPSAMVDRCVASLTIPIADDVESLNAAVAGAIVMYALRGLSPSE